MSIVFLCLLINVPSFNLYRLFLTCVAPSIKELYTSLKFPFEYPCLIPPFSLSKFEIELRKLSRDFFIDNISVINQVPYIIEGFTIRENLFL